MAVVIDATLGGANSNSYITLADANTYFEARLYSDTWTDATEDDKNRSLAMATRRIDQEDFYGDRETTTQALKFPRSNLGSIDGIDLDGTIPKQVKEAQCELAIYMLTTDMSQKPTDVGGVKGVKVASIAVDFIEDSTPNVTDYSELPPFVNSLLSDLSRTVSSGGWTEVGR